LNRRLPPLLLLLPALCLITPVVADQQAELQRSIDRIVESSLEMTEEVSVMAAKLSGLGARINAAVTRALDDLPDDIHASVAVVLNRAADEVASVELDDDTIIHRDGEPLTFGELSPEEQEELRGKLRKAAEKLRSSAAEQGD